MANESTMQQLAEAMQTTRTLVQDARNFCADIKALLTAGAVSVQNFPNSVPVTGTFWQTTQPVSFPATQPVSVQNWPAPPTSVTFPSAQPVTLDAISLGTAAGKTNVLKTNPLTTTATTADQVVLTYTVTTGKTLYLEYLAVIARLTTLSATASILGAWSLEAPSGTKLFTWTCTNPTTSHLTPFVMTFPEPMSVPSNATVRVVTTPAAATSMLWLANFGGYEK